jgi:hypothetical protein
MIQDLFKSQGAYNSYQTYFIIIFIQITRNK